MKYPLYDIGQHLVIQLQGKLGGIACIMSDQVAIWRVRVLIAKEEERMDTGSQPAVSATLQGREILSNQLKHEGEFVGWTQGYFMKTQGQEVWRSLSGCGIWRSARNQSSLFLLLSMGSLGLICFFLFIWFVLFSLCMVGKMSQLKYCRPISQLPRAPFQIPWREKLFGPARVRCPPWSRQLWLEQTR